MFAAPSLCSRRERKKSLQQKGKKEVFAAEFLSGLAKLVQPVDFSYDFGHEYFIERYLLISNLT